MDHRASPRSGYMALARCLMRATWTKGRLWGLVPAAGMELPGVVLTKAFSGVKGKRLVVNAQT